MIPAKEYLREAKLPDDLLDPALRYFETGDESIPRNIPQFKNPWINRSLGSALAGRSPWNEHSRKLLRFFIGLADGAPSNSTEHPAFLLGVVHAIHSRESKISRDVAGEIIREIESHSRSLPQFFGYYLATISYGLNWDVGDIGNEEAPFACSASNLIYRHLPSGLLSHPDLLSNHHGLFAALAVHRRDLTLSWALNTGTFRSFQVKSAWEAIVTASDAYDDLCLNYCRNAEDGAFPILNHLNQSRNGIHLEDLIEAASNPGSSLNHHALEILLKHRNAEVISIMTRAFAIQNASLYISIIDNPPYLELYKLAIERWNDGGDQLFLNLIANPRRNLTKILTDYFRDLTSEHYPTIREGFLLHVDNAMAKNTPDCWQTLAGTYPAACEADFKTLLTGKSKPLREIAANALVKIGGSRFIDEITPQLSQKKADARHGAVLFLAKLADPSTLPMLREALAREESDDVRLALHQAVSAIAGTDEDTSPGNLTDLEAAVSRVSKSTKLPKTDWLDPAALPDLPPLSKQAVIHLIARQSKHKTIEASPDIAPLLPHVDRTKSTAFANHLLEGFLNSSQAASDRWALTLAGLLGNAEVIPPLLQRIPDWCDNSRHKLAEYAAQTISLLPGNEPLTVLDTLSNRYRNKFKNVGAACAAAFGAAAAARGITPDELGDMVVPDFGFDEEGLRKFEWDGGSVHAELTTDFKLEWFDPETGKSWKSLPSSAPADIQTEVKTLTKLLRETVKGQSARLELTLVRQRRWPVARWRELFERHPVLRSFASRLVWAVYEETGKPLRTFRRYSNGLLANANGDLEELPESDIVIGMVHPLELDAETLTAWKNHLARFKIKPPFPQIDRPVVLLDPLHDNRREISLTRGKELSAGTFRSRSEKRGWMRGAVVDAGGISSYFKPYPGAGIEVILPTEGLWIGNDPMDTVTLGAACFVASGTVERGSYTYDEPNADDERVLPFSSISAVVYSETVSDLQAIIGES